MNFKRLMNWALRRNEKEASDSSPSRPYYLSNNAHPRDQRADAFISEFFKRPDLVTNQQILNKASLSYKSRILVYPLNHPSDVSLHVVSGPVNGEYCRIEIYFSGDMFKNSWMYFGKTLEQVWADSPGRGNRVYLSGFEHSIPSKSAMDRLWKIRLGVEERLQAAENARDYRETIQVLDRIKGAQVGRTAEQA